MLQQPGGGRWGPSGQTQQALGCPSSTNSRNLKVRAEACNKLTHHLYKLKPNLIKGRSQELEMSVDQHSKKKKMIKSKLL